MSGVTDAARELAGRLGLPLDLNASPGDVATALTRAVATSDGAARKDLRRMLYRLTQAGVAVPARPAEPVTPIFGPSVEAWVSAVDGRGDRLVWLLRESPSGQLLLVAADLNEPAGLRDLRVFDVTRKQLRAMRQRFHAEAGLTFVAANWRAIDALVLEAQDRLEQPDRRLDYRRIRPRVTQLAPLAPSELRSAHVVPPDDNECPRLVTESAALLTEPELRTWWPRPEAVTPLLAEIRAIRESRIVLAPAHQEERLREILARAVSVFFPAPSTARRLEAMAFVFGETGRPDQARRALAVAATLRTTPTGDVPLLQALVHQSLGTQLAATEAARREERAGALVLTPGEVATAKSPSRPPRGPG